MDGGLVADESSDLRWLTERIDRHYAETAADIAELKTAVASIPVAMDRYVLQRVYEADEKAREVRFKHLEDNASSTRASGRAWVLGIGLTAVGVVFGWLAQILQARGGH